MNDTTRRSALFSFYENLSEEQRDLDYYLNPTGISRRAEILRLLEAQPGDTIGDFGCGEGQIAGRLHGSGLRIFGCDISPSRVRLAARNGISAVSADVLQLPFKDEFFDKAICTEVLEHVLEPAVALTEIWRVLVSGGQAVLTVPLDENLQKTLLDIPEEMLRSGNYYEIKRKFQLKNAHLSSFSSESFQTLLQSCGFDVKNLAYTHDYALKNPLLLKAARKLCHTVAGNRLTSALYPRMEAFVHPVIFACYRRLEAFHHIVVYATKVSHRLFQKSMLTKKNK